MRRIVIAVCAVIGIIIIALLILPSILNVNRYRPQIQAELQQKLDRPVKLGNLSLRILPLSIRVNGITIGEAPQFPSSRPFATANEVYASAGLLSLLRGAPELKDVTLDNPQIELIRNAQGVWNYSTVGSPSTPPSGTSNTKPSNGGGAPFTLNRLKIVNGQVGLTDQSTHQPRSVYKHINLTLSDFVPNKAFNADLGVQLPGQGKETVEFNGKVGPLPPGNAAATPVTGKISIQQVSLAGLNSLLPGTIPPQTDGVATGSADVNTTNETLTVKGNLNLDNAVVRGYKVDYPISANYDLSDNRKQDLLQINSMIAKLGPTPISISGSMNSSTTPANVDLHVSTTNAPLTQISQIAGAFSQSAEGLKGTGSLSLNVSVKGPADPAKLTYSGTGSLSNASLTSPALTKPLLVHSANIQFAENGASISNLVASLGTTSLQGNLSASNFAAPQLKFALAAGTIDVGELEQITSPTPPPTSNKPQPATKQASGRPAPKQPSLVDTLTGSGTLSAHTIKAQDIVLSNVQTSVKLNKGIIELQPLSADLFGGKGNGAITLDVRPATPLCSMNAKLSGVDTNSLLSAISSVKNTLYGTLAADANVNFALASSAELPRTLNGTLGFNVTNGELKNVNILNEISKVGKFVGAAPAQQGSGTKLSKLSGTFDIRNGVATTNNLVAGLNEGSLSANGSLNLADQGINMHVNAVLASGTSKAVGGTSVGGYLNTALANNKGELVIPAIVTGTMAHPIFVPDVQAIAKMKLSHLLPSTGNPGTLASGILGSALGGKGGSAGGVINGILGGGKNQQNSQQQNKQQQNNGLNSLFNKFGKKKPQ